MNRRNGWICAVLMAGVLAGMVCAIGMRVQPGGALIQGFPVGERRELPTPLVIFNDDNVARTMTVEAVLPSSVGNVIPRGYNEMPDPAWMSFEPKEIIVPPNGHGAFKMFLNIPEGAERLNQHWSISLAVRGIVGGRQRIGLAVYPRFEIETRYADAEQAPAGAFTLTPSCVVLEDMAAGGEARAPTLKLWNNTAETQKVSFSVYARPKPGERGGVALSNGQSWMPDAGWIQAPGQVVSVAAGQSADVPIRVAVPKSEQYMGGAWEAVLLAVAEEGYSSFARVRADYEEIA